jgi:hypothetical protein
MSTRPTRRNLRPALWLAISLIGFVAGVGLGNVGFALLASLAMVGALVSVERYPRNRG